MKISIVTVCLNSENSIEKTIKSVIDQEYSDIEYIIIDGGSSDQTVEIIQKYKKFITTFISEADLGVYDGINKGISYATGDIVSILHSDDYYAHKRVLLNVVNIFKKKIELKCLVGATYMVKKENDVIVRKYSPVKFKNWMFNLGISPPHPSMFLKKEIYDQYGLYKTDYKIAGDFEFYLRIILKKKIKIFMSNTNYVIMRLGGKSTMSFKSNFISSREILKILKKNGVYSNWAMVLLRFPIKIIQYIFKR